MKKQTVKSLFPDIYQDNLYILKKRFPHVFELVTKNKDRASCPVDIFLNANGQVNAYAKRDGGETLNFYDAEDIVEETKILLAAQPLNQNDILLCIGLGLGYVPLVASELYENKPKILILERFPEIFNLAISSVDLTPLFKYENLEICLGSDFNAKEIISRHENILYTGCCRRITHLPSRSVFGEKFNTLEREVIETMNFIQTGWNTRRKYGANIFENCVNNLSSLFNGITIDRIKNKFKGFPAVCVASGPSLENDISILKEIKDRVVILACDSAVRPLLNAGIIPHMIVAVDHLNIDFEKIRDCLEDLRQTILVYLMDANGDSVRGFLGDKRVAVMSGNTFMQGWLITQFGMNSQLPGMVSSNADAAMLTAVAIGADPIILVGMDLALSEGKDHVKGSVFRNEVERVNTAMTEGVNGFPVYTFQAMVVGKTVMEENIRCNQRTCVDVSRVGALINGTKIHSLLELDQTILKEKVYIDDIVGNMDWSPVFKNDDVLRSFDVLNGAVLNLKTDAVKGLKKVCRILCSAPKTYKTKTTTDVRNALKFYSRFEKQYKILLLMINDQRYGEQLAVDRKIVNLGQGEKLSAHRLNMETLDIQKRYFRSIYINAGRILKMLEAKREYFQKSWELSDLLENAGDDGEIRLKLAKVHADEGVVWLAEKEYMRYLEKNPHSIEAVCALFHLYTGMRMWKQAKAVIDQGYGINTQQYRIDALRKEMNEKLSDILVSAKEKLRRFLEENVELRDYARLEVAEYLSIYPDDPQALMLLDKIEGSEKQQETEIREKHGFSFRPEDVELLKFKAAQNVGEGMFEKAVGIYEGLIRQFPDEESLYRMKIGDIRFQQADFISALWNYEKEAGPSSENKALNSRIRFAKPLLEAMDLPDLDMDTGFSIIIPVAEFREDRIDFIKEMVNGITGAHELLLICRNEDKEIYLEKLKTLPANIHFYITGGDRDPMSPYAVNTALKRSKGKYVLLTDTAYRNADKMMRGMIQYLEKVDMHGIVGAVKNDFPGFIKTSHQTRAAYHRGVLAMTKCLSLPISFTREVLGKTGLFDESCENIAEMLEDYRIRVAMAGFRNIIALNIVVKREKNIDNGPGIKSLDEKYRKENLPECFREPYFVMRLFEKARKLRERGRIQEAFATLADGIRSYPDCEAIYLETAHILVLENCCAEAVKIIETIPETSPVDADKRAVLLARALLGAGNTSEAIAHADAVLKANPSHAQILNLKGMAAYINKDMDNAERLFRAAIVADYADGLSWLNLGRLKFTQGLKISACRLVQKSFFMSGNIPEIMNEYHWIAENLGCMDVAAMHFERAVTLYPFNKALHYLLIDLLMKCGNYEKAMMFIEMSMAKFGTSDGILDAVEEVREQLGSAYMLQQCPEKVCPASVIQTDSDIWQTDFQTP